MNYYYSIHFSKTYVYSQCHETPLWPVCRGGALTGLPPATLHNVSPSAARARSASSAPSLLAKHVQDLKKLLAGLRDLEATWSETATWFVKEISSDRAEVCLLSSTSTVGPEPGLDCLA